jgi:hypothetical protein
MYDMSMISAMSHQLNEMFLFMKHENIISKRQQQQQQQQQQSMTTQTLIGPLNNPDNKTTVDATSGDKILSPLPPKIDPFAKIRALQETVNDALAALLAHTAATAHIAAASSITASYYYASTPEYQKQQQQMYDAAEKKANALPLTTEIENASNTFAKYKKRLASFFEKKEVFEKKESVPSTSHKEKSSNPLMELIAHYADKNENELLKLNNNNNNNNNNKKNQNDDSSDDAKDNDNVYSEDEDDDDGDDDDTQLQIVTTSELKKNPHKFNYLMPSLKATYFPLKASLQTPNYENQNETQKLVAVENTANALTFLGTPSSITTSFYNANERQNKRLQLADILYINKNNN